MKHYSTLVVPVIFCLICTSACKKDKPVVNPDAVRLIGLDMKVNGGSSNLHISFVNDPAGKIRQITSKVDYAASPDILYNVLYNANNPNEIIVAVPAVIGIDRHLTDTIHLFLDGNNRVIKKIRHAFEAYELPTTPQGIHKFDTTTYEYDGAGLLNKETRGFRDSTWLNSVTLQTTNIRTTGESIYTNSNGDLRRVKSLSNITTTYHMFGNTAIEIRTSTGDLTLDYYTLFSNKTDFTNAAVLDQLNWFAGLPMNKNYQHLPSNTKFIYEEKDINGTTVYTNSSFSNNTYSYNYYGFVESKMDPAYPSTKVTYVYSQ